ncbi:M48 family metallopeptidase [Bacillus sp. MRMR6]|uniref:M48 family metallopeptidase n=1 Tax=Bacillus sp. MRMR6 TaxID=1928617 RepID=UPI000952A8D6|nr:SprT family zinc-dependent metalloprotease [Bacillus sp. MRMR6]OLS40987.1 zinc protease [Bacillus sp. MRMR6]
MLHTYLDETIRYEIKYKNRTSFGITVDSYGNVEVQAPKGTSDSQVIQILETNWNLIQAKVKEMTDRLNGPQRKAYEHGERFLYLGRDYPIQFFQDEQIEKDTVEFKGDELHIQVKQLEDERIKQALKRFYYKQCKALVEKSISNYQSSFNTKPRSIRISDSKTTWGTCDSRQQLTFNWKLAMAPLEVIKYVVVHEMCHMVHLNHDRSFWRLVGKIMPDYKEKEKWLAASSWKMTV